MRKLVTLLGMPQHRFAPIHVVGTNGKSSVTRMTAALLEAHGIPTGACLSPHLDRWSERVMLGGSEIGPAEFADSVKRAADAAGVVNRSLEGGEEVTQFEVSTAAAFMAFATAGVKAAVVEAGLGGRLDATNVIPSKVTVLTSVGLDHTDWLGETVEEIAAEKLAVLRDGSTLVLGDVPPGVRDLAVEAAERHLATLVEPDPQALADIPMRAAGPFQRRNFALACAAAAAFRGSLDPALVERVAAEIVVPARLEWIARDPPTLIDAAHNPDGAAALAEALGEVAEGWPVFACLAILEDKDARGVVAALAPAIEHLTVTAPPAEVLEGRGRPGARFRDAGLLAEIAADLGIAAEAVPDPAEAIRRTRERAEAGRGVALVTGSHHLLAMAVRTVHGAAGR